MRCGNECDKAHVSVYGDGDCGRGDEVSVLIRGMRMPSECRKCPMMDYGTMTGETYCKVNGKALAESFRPIEFDGRPEWCPLVEVKTPHGDLIDRQKLIEDNKHLEYPTDEKYRRDRAWAVGFNAGARHCNEHAVYAKTVIEAEGAEE